MKQSPATKTAKGERALMMRQYLREAKACEEAAIRAEAEAAEYRRKARELLDNAMAEAALFDGVDAENFLEVSDCQDSEKRQSHSAAASHKARAADHHHRDGAQLTAGAGFGVALLFLRGLADARHR